MSVANATPEWPAITDIQRMLDTYYLYHSMPGKRNAKFVIDIFASKGSLLILGSLTLLLGYSVMKESYRRHQVQVEIDSLKQEIIALENRNTGLTSIIGSFENPKNIELEAKRRLNLKKPGENVVVILRDKDNESQNIVRGGNFVDEGQDLGYSEKETSARGAGNPLKWWRYITSEK